MGTRSVVAIPTAEGWRGRYIHWDGYPQGVGESLLLIVKRDGLDLAVKVLTEHHFGWSSVDDDAKDAHEDASRFRFVPGYGTAYSAAEQKDRWVTFDGDNWGTEYAYVLTSEAIIVLGARTDANTHAVGMFGVSPGAHWTELGRVAYTGSMDDLMVEN